MSNYALGIATGVALANSNDSRTEECILVDGQKYCERSDANLDIPDWVGTYFALWALMAIYAGYRFCQHGGVDLSSPVEFCLYMILGWLLAMCFAGVVLLIGIVLLASVAHLLGIG